MIQKTIQKHETDFIHTSKKQLGFFFLSLLTLGLNIINFIFIINTWKFLELKDLTIETANQLLIIYPLIQQYVLIALFLICLIIMIKGKIKTYNENGLIGGLIGGLNEEVK